ncbi:MAG: type IV secretory system conjugative DNA transfer family protein [Rickettsiales bacterium]|nr:type IV secretory system conjugative DNA transfer family protein [Rickettsiales bacterium]
MPTLLSWEESLIVHDFRGENFTITSGYREKSLQQKVFLWDPANRRKATHCYNPLDYVADRSVNPLPARAGSLTLHSNQ